ncbi:hypothetical protein DERP_005953 [Dermatophagoides pteronyssinus]|uniref:Uncharacterized protein n=1 Tax=Dermatophagoides pteronyssinus TaxID=6956 RepID=A0ABQ8JRV8_DERPT|nr:hypothetical protein DERP_005953 [Dermatophagoides pteronyssinus]
MNSSSGNKLYSIKRFKRLNVISRFSSRVNSSIDHANQMMPYDDMVIMDNFQVMMASFVQYLDHYVLVYVLDHTDSSSSSSSWIEQTKRTEHRLHLHHHDDLIQSIIITIILFKGFLLNKEKKIQIE